METSIVSEKYQVVIPKHIRKKMNIVPGQKFVVTSKNNTITIKPAPTVDDFIGSMRGAWDKDPAATIRKMRDEWDENSSR